MNVYSAAEDIMAILEDNDHIIKDNVVNLLECFGTNEALIEYQKSIPESSEEDLCEMLYFD